MDRGRGNVVAARDRFLTVCEEAVTKLFQPEDVVYVGFQRHRARATSDAPGIYLMAFGKHLTRTITIEECSDLLLKTVVIIGTLKLSIIYMSAHRADPELAVDLLRGFLRLCLASATDPKRIQQLTTILDTSDATSEDTTTEEENNETGNGAVVTPEFSRLAGVMSSTIAVAQTDIYQAFRGDEGILPDGISYARTHLKKGEEIMDGLTGLKKVLDVAAHQPTDN